MDTDLRLWISAWIIFVAVLSLLLARWWNEHNRF